MAQVSDMIEQHGITKIIAMGTALLGIAVFFVFHVEKRE